MLEETHRRSSISGAAKDGIPTDTASLSASTFLIRPSICSGDTHHTPQAATDSIDCVLLVFPQPEFSKIDCLLVFEERIFKQAGRQGGWMEEFANK